MRNMTTSPSNNRSMDKILEDAEASGSLNLSNRRLKDISQLTYKYDLCDITNIDLSHNHLYEVPSDAYDWQCMETLALSHNSIKCIPDFISEFRLLRTLDLSSNQLTVLPPEIAELRSLLILRLGNNKIISLPEEIGQLQQCQELDVSSNELTSLPAQISDMISLKFLNVCKNSLFSLPEQLSSMKLWYLNASCNMITHLPVSFRNMTTLKTLTLDNNPLSTPQLSVLRKGRVHVFRELEILAEKMQIKKEVMEDPLMSPMKHRNSRSDINFMEMKPRTWSNTDVKEETAEMYAEKAAELVKDRRQKVAPSTPERKKVTPSTPEKKKVTPEDRKLKETKSEPMMNPNAPATPPQDAKPTRKGTVVDAKANGKKKTVTIISERRRSSSSGNFERKNSREALLINQKLSGFPGYKTHVNDKKSDTITSNGKTVTSNTKEVLQEFVKTRQALSPSERNNQTQNEKKKGFIPAAIKPRAFLGTRRRGNSLQGDKDSSFTMRRKTEKLYEELELMETLRQNIEGRLKIQLGDELPSALSDGVVLCHLTNHLKPRSVPSIHVPSPAVPKLSLAKRRRNIDNFLAACSKFGVIDTKLCSAQDILLEKNIAKVAGVVTELLRLCPNSVLSPKHHNTAPTVQVAPSTLTNKKASAV